MTSSPRWPHELRRLAVLGSPHGLGAGMTSSGAAPTTPVSLPITGGCGCGAVRFELTEPFISSLYCHCTRCQRRSGTAASANARASAAAFHLLQGEDRIRSWKPDDGAEKFFCGDCGSALFSRSPGASTVGVRLGAIDGDPGIRPSARQYVAYAAAWEPIPNDGLPRYPESQSAGPAPPDARG